MKPAEGVTFTRYDKYGYKITDEPVNKEDDYRQFLAKEGDDAGFEFIAASDEQLERALAM